MECETFLNGYKNWEIWCKNRYTEEIFYRQELTDGTAVIVKAFPYTDEFQQEREGTKMYLFKPEMKHLKDAESSRLAVIQYLKTQENKMGWSAYRIPVRRERGRI